MAIIRQSCFELNVFKFADLFYLYFSELYKQFNSHSQYEPCRLYGLSTKIFLLLEAMQLGKDAKFFPG